MNTFLLHLASITVLAIAVEAACRIGRFRPAICHALWLVVLVKLLVPPLVAWPVTVDTIASVFSTTSSTGKIDQESAGDNSIRHGIMAGGWSPGEGTADTSSGIGSVEARGIGLTSVLLGLWAIGGLTVVARVAMHVHRGRRRIATGEAMPEWLQTQLAQSCALLDVPVPRAVIARDPGGVYMQITGRPTLVISADALEHVGAEQWHTILTHELAHLKRRDHWVAWLMLTAGAVWWWNPCFWWVRNRIYLFSEMACDAWVVNVHPGDRKQYAETMVRIMAMLSRQDAPAPAMGLAAWSAATQERRLWMIMKAKGGCRVPWLGAAGVAVLAALVSPAWLADSAEEGTRPEPKVESAGWKLSLEPTENVQKKQETPISLQMNDAHLKDIVETLSDKYDVNIALDFRAMDRAPKRAPFQGAVPGLRGGDTTSAKSHPSGEALYASDGIVPTFDMSDVPLGEALKEVTQDLNLTVQLRGDTVWISSPALIAADQLVPLPVGPSASEAMLKSLRSNVNIEFEDIHLRDVMGFIEEVFRVQITVDERVVLPEGGDIEAARKAIPTLATDGIIAYINLKDAPLSEALYHMTRLLNLTYTVREDQIYISTPDLIDKPEGTPAAK